MKTMQPIREEIKGSDLPDSLRKKANVLPGEVVTITIQPSMDKSLKELLEVMDKAGEEAQKRGLTDEKLSDLLKDES